jgi:hypothetical protein
MDKEIKQIVRYTSTGLAVMLAAFLAVFGLVFGIVNDYAIAAAVLLWGAFFLIGCSFVKDDSREHDAMLPAANAME